MIRQVFRWKKHKEVGKNGEPAKWRNEAVTESEVTEDSASTPKNDEKAAKPKGKPTGKSDVVRPSPFLSILTERKKPTGAKERPSEISAESYYSLPEYDPDHPHQHAALAEWPEETKPSRLYDMFIILLFWSMRFFIPWMSAWHGYNVFILANPSEWESKGTRDRLLTHDLIIFGSTCAIALLSSVVSDVCRVKYHLLLTFFLLYSLCPIAGAAADVILRSRPHDATIYQWWFTSAILMRWAMAIPNMSFPVQFACIFAQKEDMSRWAHYNWAAIFIFIESLNSFVAFWVMPPKCPTAEWTQITVWMIIGFLLCVVTLSTIVTTLLTHLGLCTGILGLPRKNPDSNMTILEKDEIPQRLKMKKLSMILLMLVPVIFTSFVFSALEGAEPGDWDRHRFLSATSLFFMGKVLGIIWLVAIQFFTRKILTNLKKPTSKADPYHFLHTCMLLVLGLFFLLYGFATLSHKEPDGVVFGPIPDAGKTVVEFYNVDPLKRSICVRSEFFHPFTVRPLRRGTVELYERDDGENITFSVCSDPSTTPAVYTHSSFAYKNNTWTTFVVYLPLKSPDEEDEEELRTFQSLVVSRATGTETIRPVDDPQLIFMNTFVNDPSGYNYVLTWSEGSTPFKEQARLALENHHKVLNREGDLKIAYAHNTADASRIVETFLKVKNYSVYCVLLCTGTPYTSTSLEPFTVTLLTFKMAEVAGPNSMHLPADEELQHDWAIKLGMCLAGMASSGFFVGYIYLFWLDPPFHQYRTICLAAFWVFNMGAGLVPEVKQLDASVSLLSILLCVFVVLAYAHVFCAFYVYSPRMNFRRTPQNE